MVIVNGKLNSTTLSGSVTATPDHPFIDTSTSPPTLVSMPITATITNGAFAITVPQSQQLSGSTAYTEGITYSWQLFQSVTTITFYFLSGLAYVGPNHQWTDNNWYTGSVHDSSSVRLDRVSTTTLQQITDTIHAVAPNVASVNYTDLVNIPSQQPWLDVSIYRLAELLTGTQLYRDRISAKFRILGAYSASTAYILNDVVNYNGNSYVWINASSVTGQTPPTTGNNTYWFMLAAQGVPGGTGANIVGYSASAWAGSSQAAAREDVRAAIASVSSVDLSNYYTKSQAAPINNASFTGFHKRQTLSYPVAAADVDTEIPSCTYVENAILAKGYGKFPAPLIYARRANALAVPVNTITPIIWDNRVGSSSQTLMNTSGRFTLTTGGDHLIMVTALVGLSGSAGSSTSRAEVNFSLHSDDGTGALTFVDTIHYSNLQSQAADWVDRKVGFLFAGATAPVGGTTGFGLIAGVQYVITCTIQGTGLNSSGHSISPSSVTNGGLNSFVTIWKVG